MSAPIRSLAIGLVIWVAAMTDRAQATTTSPAFAIDATTVNGCAVSPSAR